MAVRVVTAAAVMLAGCLDAVSGSTCVLNPAVNAPSHTQGATQATTPSRLDYLALASMADAQSPLAMAGYRPSKVEPLAP